MNPEIVTCAGQEGLAETAASRIAEFLREDVSERGRATLVLSGGETPEATYGSLADISGLPWQDVFIFWGDERMVEHGHPDRNSTMAFHALLDRIDIPASHIFTVPDGCGTAASCADRYESTLRGFFGRTVRYPVFDTVLLGIGGDGHTASLYPGGRELTDSGNRWVVGVTAPARYALRERVSLTLPVLNNAHRAVFIVSGSRKRNILSAVVSTGCRTDSSLPARRVDPRSTLLIMTDLDAGCF
jgi:6-phosphogluconolactonase